MNSTSELCMTAPPPRGVFKSQKRIRRYARFARQLHSGEFGTRDQRVENTPVAQAFWAGYDGTEPVPDAQSDLYIAYRLGSGARQYDDMEAEHPRIGDRIVTAAQREVWEAMPVDRWTDAAYVASHCTQHPLSVGRALQVLAQIGLIERKYDTPPSYRKRSNAQHSA